VTAMGTLEVATNVCCLVCRSFRQVCGRLLCATKLLLELGADIKAFFLSGCDGLEAVLALMPSYVSCAAQAVGRECPLPGKTAS
jgi:hypothetical protein